MILLAQIKAQTKHFVRSHKKYRAVTSNKMTAQKWKDHPLHDSSPVHYGTAVFDNHREQLSQYIKGNYFEFRNTGPEKLVITTCPILIYTTVSFLHLRTRLLSLGPFIYICESLFLYTIEEDDPVWDFLALTYKQRVTFYCSND